MAQRTAAFIFIVIAVFHGALASADEALPSQDEIVALLSTAQYAQLDRRLTSIQGAYKRGAIDDVKLREAFRSFYFTTPSLAKNFDQWVREFPESYVAHLARGIYYKKVG